MYTPSAQEGEDTENGGKAMGLHWELEEMGLMDKQGVRRDRVREVVTEEGEEDGLSFAPPTSPPSSLSQVVTGKQYLSSLEQVALHAQRQEGDQNGERAVRRRWAIASSTQDRAPPIQYTPTSCSSPSEGAFFKLVVVVTVAINRTNIRIKVRAVAKIFLPDQSPLTNQLTLPYRLQQFF